MSDIVSIISNVGFPIAACCCMGVYVVKLTGVLSELKTAIAELKTVMERKEN